MKLRNVAFIWLLLVSFSQIALAKSINYPCSGAPGIYRVNPDNSQGGFVAKSATVDATVFLDINASVCDRATLIEGAKLLEKAEVSGRATVRGAVVISGRAKIYGDSYIVNLGGDPLVVTDDAKIYGQGFLQGSVSVSGTSEVFGWGKVLEYAQVSGNSRICGQSLVKGFEVLFDDQSKCIQK